MAFNGGNCDTDAPHNKRLCTGQSTGPNNVVNLNDNNNNTNNSSNNNSNIIMNNGNIMEIDKNSHVNSRVSKIWNFSRFFGDKKIRMRVNFDCQLKRKIIWVFHSVYLVTESFYITAFLFCLGKIVLMNYDIKIIKPALNISNNPHPAGFLTENSRLPLTSLEFYIKSYTKD